MSFKESCVVICKKQYFVDVCENRGDFGSRLTDLAGLMDGHVVKIVVFHTFSQLFGRVTWELKVAVLCKVDFLLDCIASGLPGLTRVDPGDTHRDIYIIWINPY